VRRRELLASAAGLAGAAALGLPPAGWARTQASPAGSLEEVLYGNLAAEPVPLAALRGATGCARACFQAASYDRLAAALPRLIGAAAATRDSADGDERATASTLLADAYITATNFAVKLNDDAFGWALADRALQAAPCRK
jgi:hypothetical protein